MVIDRLGADLDKFFRGGENPWPIHTVLRVMMTMTMMMMIMMMIMMIMMMIMMIIMMTMMMIGGSDGAGQSPVCPQQGVRP